MGASLLPRATRELLERIEVNVPRELLDECRWVAWDRTPRNDGRPSKKPLNPKTGKDAKSNDPRTWAKFGEAGDAALRLDCAGGIGVMLTGGPWLAIDLDHVINLDTGELAQSARTLLDALQPTYIELSPCGDGLHIWFRGQKPAGWASQVAAALGPRTGLEAYDGTSSRYFTVTGRVWTDAPVANATESDLATLAALLVRKKKPKPTAGPPAASRASANRDDDAARARWLLLEEGVLDDIVDQYDGWLRVLAALRNLGPAGLEVAVTWSRRGAKFVDGDIERRWTGLDGSNIASLFGMADDRDPDWRRRWREIQPVVDVPPFLRDEAGGGATPGLEENGAKKVVSEAPAEPIVPKAVAARRWPKSLSSHVRYALVGEFLDLVEEETEADPAAMVVDLLVRVGNAVGRGAHFEVGGDRHACNLFAAIVGETGQGRKGTSAAYPRQAMGLADQEWSESRCLNGLSSGEGVIWAVRDPGPSGRTDKNGAPVTDPGVSDKRLLVFETELARTLHAAGRKGSTLTAILRQGWEGARLAVMTKVPYAATDAHVSLLAHVTEVELRSLLCTEDLHGGTANRLLFVCSRRQRELPFGGEVEAFALARFGKRLRDAVEHGKTLGRMPFSDAAREAWPEAYCRLLRDERTPGMRGALLARAVVQVRRVAMVFAILDMDTRVDVPHLDAAIEVWRYCRDSVSFVFGSDTGNPTADRLLGEMRGTPAGLDRTSMHRLFDRHVTAEAINEALRLLHEQGLAAGVRIPTSGRPREVWRDCELRNSGRSEERSQALGRPRRRPS